MSHLDRTPAGTECLLDETGELMNNMVTYTRCTVTVPVNMAAWTADISQGHARRRRATGSQGLLRGESILTRKMAQSRGVSPKHTYI